VLSNRPERLSPYAVHEGAGRIKTFPPIVVEPVEVRRRLVKLEKAFSEYLDDLGLTESSEDWYVYEIGHILGVYRLAAASDASVLFVIQPPWVEERASRVVIPIGAIR
jgi:hypothetical protein